MIRVIIRYAVDYLDGCPTREWTDHREVLFQNYTLPSLRWQTDQNFEVFCLIDPRVEHNNDVIWHETENWQASAKELSGKGITTVRLDSDDMLMPGAIAAIRARAAFGYNIMPDGLQTVLRTGQTTAVNDPRGPFLARVGGNVYEHAHGLGVSRSGVPLHTIPGILWNRIIHDRNMTNG